MARREIIVEVTVALGAGSATFGAYATLKELRWITPNDGSTFGADTFGWTIFDSGSYPVDGRASTAGERSFASGRTLDGPHVLRVASASANGVYKAKLVMSSDDRGNS